MAETVVSDAARVPQDEGVGGLTDGNEAWNSAGLMALLGQAAQSGSYVRSDSECTFASHDGTNDTVDVAAGVAYLSLAGVTVDVQSTVGGTSAPSYDTTITTNTMPAVCVVLPTATTVDVQDSTLSSVWLAYDTDGTGPGGSAGDVYLRSDDTGSVTAPSHPSVKLGEANPDNASADVLTNRFGSPTFDAADMTSLVIGGTIYEEDANSPINVSATTSVTYTVNGDYDLVYIFPATGSGDVGLRQLQVNGNTGTNYDYVDNSDTETTGQTEWETQRTRELEYVVLIDTDQIDEIQCRVSYARSITGNMVYGSMTAATGTGINQFTYKDGSGNTRDFRARVYGRNMDV